MKNKKILNTVLGLGAICIIAFSCAFAYLTDNESDYTNFAVRHVRVDLVEGGMRQDPDPAKAGGMTYGEEYDYIRDNNVDDEEYTGKYYIGVTPYAHNSAPIDAVVFMEVVVPMVNIDTIESKNRGRLPVHDGYPNKTDAFTFTFGEYDGSEEEGDFYGGHELQIGEYSSKWIYMHSTYYTSEQDDTVVSCGYLYGYRQKLSAWGQTDPLFDWLRVTNFATEENGADLDLTIRLYAIQANSIIGSSAVVLSDESDSSEARPVGDVWWLQQYELEHIFNTYINQDPVSFVSRTLDSANEVGRYDAGGAER